ncbi:class I SAM-dependent methyltransferase [Rhizobium sp. RU36D]|uniref:class I SAM-dependent methyltransferase n=1 Tax=Rhizobium sp. RU36D TaxID=1907415 RepID=UPI0009D903B2|nr:class I SAM-dependent methyltransferase [Rhizobium sp. RU36D]SMD19600.1 Methyltransferase domain-containing protein [Rhizobium sp. RU36D]
MHRMEDINRQTWSNSWALREYGRGKGYIDEGERVVLDRATADGPKRVLDIGVGGGRTAGLLQGKGDYLGIDYTPEMVELARRNHPSLTFRHMDARDLSALPDGAFDLVNFSYNGIDSVDQEGRMAVLREVARVLEPGGQFVFSTFHRNWDGFSKLPDYRHIEWTLDPLRLSFRLFRFIEGGILKAVRTRRHAALEVRAADHAILMHGAHDFGIMVHTTTYPHLIGQLREAGFAEVIEVFNRDGERIDADWSGSVEYVHVIARKRVTS